ncbi:hypothetical protein LPJ66_005932 [Kickxella alabastrina]|uniref:Uncharacterized protein n=1 Tax=Kickxella alabastrina TaxID=61397 RepID=A0ACC1ICY5_9FUNG|nr:hypothetical protein LPJ66_005932 [Kickxella alabastrina]
MGVVRNIYLSWKALRFPWRKDVFKGSDLEGNLYFERMSQSTVRPRRVVVYRENFAISDYKDDIIPVQWQAWMRHTRDQPPSIGELVQEIQRRKRLAENVRILDLARKQSQDMPELADQSEKKEQPIAFQKSAPGESYQPEGWTPSPPSNEAPASGRCAGEGRARGEVSTKEGDGR